MSESEIITTLGFLNINVSRRNTLTPEKFAKLLPFSQLNMGIDLLSSKPLVRRKSRSFFYGKENTDEVVAKALFDITFAVIRWLKEEKIYGNIVFCYKQRVEYYDLEFECGAFTPPNTACTRQGQLAPQFDNFE